MGRHTTGALTTGEITRIELSFLLKNKFIQKGHTISFTLNWTSGSNISVISCYNPDDIWLQLIYTLTDYEGNTFNYDYKIYLTERASNIGVGKVLYFICPNSGNFCRILYRCYGSHIWKSRQAYKTRIYYPCQTSSKLNYFNSRYWQIEDTLNKMKEKRKTVFYKGIRTRRSERMNKLIDKQIKFDDLRWTLGLPKRFREIFGKTL